MGDPNEPLIVTALVHAQHGCAEEVSRMNRFEPCDKTAVALHVDELGDVPYPVCAYHSRGEMVPLADIVTAIVEDGD